MPTTTAGAATEPGQGYAFAQSAKVDPKAGALSIGIAFGQSTATHTNQVAKAVSTATNLGVVGATLAAQQCNGNPPTWARESQPQPYVVDSRDAGAAKETTDIDYAKNDSKQWAFTKTAQATAAPFAKAVTRTMAVFDSGFNTGFDVGTMSSAATSGIENGQRVARATVDVAYINFPGVNLRLGKLRWDAVYRSTGDKKVEGRFTIGSVVRDGQQQNTDPRTDPRAVLDSANVLLKELGLKLVPGTTRIVGDRVIVEPLSITVVPDRRRDEAAKRAADETDDEREALFDEILEKDCRAGTYISVFDIITGSVTGAGELVLSLGGVEASSGEVPKNPFNLDFTAPFGTTPDVFIPPVESSFTGVPAVDPPTVSIAAPPVAPTQPVTRVRRAPQTAVIRNADHSEPFTGTRGGALAVVGIVTLAVTGLVAEGDRRRIKAARAMAEGSA